MNSKQEIHKLSKEYAEILRNMRTGGGEDGGQAPPSEIEGLKKFIQTLNFQDSPQETQTLNFLREFLKYPTGCIYC